MSSINTYHQRIFFVYGLLLVLVLNACTNKAITIEHPAFEILTHEKTGLHFTNTLTPSQDFNMFNYMYFYNGAGIGSGDFNNDGKIDLFFASNQHENKLYLNKGNLQFTDVTKESAIPQDSAWSTGVSVADVNNDGLLDIYVCRVGNYLHLSSHNQLLICKGISKEGIPTYADESQAYGVNFTGFSTQAIFLDYDLDGDLDMFLINHSIHQNGSFSPRKNFVGTYSEASGDRMYRNDGKHFTDVTKPSGINSSAISYGLGVASADINLDGYPDLYVGNDFHENDYLYINNRDGTFKEENNQHLMHTSQFSMGVDIADVNNDGYPEVISMDMLPSDPYILKRSLGEDEYDIFYYKISAGYNYQYTRNNLQYNRKDGMFSEIGLYSGVYATDWSWAPLWMDYDNDGKKDLFISNGIPKRMNDMDYVNFISSEEIQQMLNNQTMAQRNLSLLNNFPEIKIPNKFFKNNGNMQFLDMEDSIANNQQTFSNGTVYADLDNDGDLDIVVNNINDPVMVYKNNTNETGVHHYCNVSPKNAPANINAIGAKVVLFSGKQIYTYENNPAKGFLSSMLEPIHIGLDKVTIDSAFLIWPDNTFQPLQPKLDSTMVIQYQKGLPKFNYASITQFYKPDTFTATDITSTTGIAYTHQENQFIEFNREPLIPHMLSTEGPALAVADINGDGLADVFAGSSKGFVAAVFVQQTNGTFSALPQPALAADSLFEDVDAIWTDVNNDHFPDLVIASGGNEFYGQERYLKPRVYLNSGKGLLTAKADAFPDIFGTYSSVTASDFNGDGAMDLFIAGRTVPWKYGEIPTSYLLQNDGTGRFTDVTNQHAEGLSQAGMITQAQWIDLDKDGDSDLLLTTEWSGIEWWINNKGTFTKKDLTRYAGWWNMALAVDVDNDGDLDIIAGNLGLNSRLKASEKEPVKMYYNDFDNNGKKEQVLCYFLKGKELAFANKDELQKQIPLIKKKFLYAGDFAKASIQDIFSEDKLNSAKLFTANYFSNAILINDGKMNFTTQALPWEAQLSPIKAAAVIDVNGDQLPDILLAGNYYDNNIQMGRYDADLGSVLVNRGNGKFDCEMLNGLDIKGQVRRIQPIVINGKPALLLAKNNEAFQVIRFNKPGN